MGYKAHKGILHFKYDEFDSLANPIIHYLTDQGVHFERGVEVTDFVLTDEEEKTIVTGIRFIRDGKGEEIPLMQNDYVFFTNGSLIQNSTYGDNDTVAGIDRSTENRGCFTLWEKLAEHDEKFGHPEKFISDVDKTNWMSFSITIRDYPQLVETIEKITGDMTTGNTMDGWKRSPKTELLLRALRMVILPTTLRDHLWQCSLIKRILPVKAV